MLFFFGWSLIREKETNLFPLFNNHRFVLFVVVVVNHCDHRLFLHTQKRICLWFFLQRHRQIPVFDSFVSVTVCLCYNEPCLKRSRFKTLLGQFNLPKPLKVVTVFRNLQFLFYFIRGSIRKKKRFFPVMCLKII